MSSPSWRGSLLRPWSLAEKEFQVHLVILQIWLVPWMSHNSRQDDVLDYCTQQTGTPCLHPNWPTTHLESGHFYSTENSKSCPLTYPILFQLTSPGSLVFIHSLIVGTHSQFLRQLLELVIADKVFLPSFLLVLGLAATLWLRYRSPWPVVVCLWPSKCLLRDAMRCNKVVDSWARFWALMVATTTMASL